MADYVFCPQKKKNLMLFQDQRKKPALQESSYIPVGFVKMNKMTTFDLVAIIP
jgi:hypothetical protein